VVVGRFEAQRARTLLDQAAVAADAPGESALLGRDVGAGSDVDVAAGERVDPHAAGRIDGAGVERVDGRAEVARLDRGSVEGGDLGGARRSVDRAAGGLIDHQSLVALCRAGAGADATEVIDRGGGHVAIEDEVGSDRAVLVDHHVAVDRTGAVEHRVGEDGDVAARAEAAVEREGAHLDIDRTGEGMLPGQGKGALAGFDQPAGAADHAAVGRRVGAVEDDEAVIGDIAGNAARGAAVADVQLARVDGGAARVGVRTVQDQGAGAVLLQAAAPRVVAGKDRDARAIDRDLGVVGDIARQQMGRLAAVAEFQATVRHRGRARGAGRARQGRRAGTNMLDFQAAVELSYLNPRCV